MGLEKYPILDRSLPWDNNDVYVAECFYDASCAAFEIMFLDFEIRPEVWLYILKTSPKLQGM